MLLKSCAVFVLPMMIEQLVNNRVDTEETATSVLEHQGHAANNEAIAEEDEGTETGAAEGHEAVTTVAQSAHSDNVLTYLVTCL